MLMVSAHGLGLSGLRVGLTLAPVLNVAVALAEGVIEEVGDLDTLALEVRDAVMLAVGLGR